MNVCYRKKERQWLSFWKVRACRWKHSPLRLNFLEYGEHGLISNWSIYSKIVAALLLSALFRL